MTIILSIISRYTEFDFGLISLLFHCYVGGPGSGKLTQSQKLLEKNPGWVHLSMGDLLRAEVAKKGSAGAKWGMIGDLVSQGEMAPEVFSQLTLIFVKNLVYIFCFKGNIFRMLFI